MKKTFISLFSAVLMFGFDSGAGAASFKLPVSADTSHWIWGDDEYFINYSANYVETRTFGK